LRRKTGINLPLQITRAKRRGKDKGKKGNASMAFFGERWTAGEKSTRVRDIEGDRPFRRIKLETESVSTMQ